MHIYMREQNKNYEQQSNNKQKMANNKTIYIKVSFINNKFYLFYF